MVVFFTIVSGQTWPKGPLAQDFFTYVSGQFQAARATGAGFLY